MRIKSLPLALALLGSVASSAALADKAYFKLEGGYAWAQPAGIQDRVSAQDDSCSICSGGSDTLDDLDNGPFMALGVGYRLSSSVRIDLMYARRKNKLNTYDDTNNINDTYTSKLKSEALMVSAYYDFPALFAGIRPYAGAGIGAARNSLSPVHQDVRGYQESEDDPGGSRTNFAWQAMLGLTLPVSSGWDVSAGYRYFDAGKVQTNAGLTTLTYDQGGTSTYQSGGISGHLRTQEFTISLQHSF